VHLGRHLAVGGIVNAERPVAGKGGHQRVARIPGYALYEPPGLRQVAHLLIKSLIL
jgi:hypothetical protein